MNNNLKVINISGTEDKLYYKKIDNGMEVYMIPNKNILNVYATFTTKYGSVVDEFVPINESKMIKVPKGIAHFLEHKVFEQEGRMQPFEFYSKSGTDCNAHTTLNNTTYEFMGPNNFQENLEYLLDFVQSPYLTEKNVEKEKGIIEQELKMYMDDPFWTMYDGIRNNVFINNPTKYPIGGTVESIYKINKNILQKCYNTFYHPSNMFLVITGNFDPEEAITIIEVNQQKKKFNLKKEIKIKEYKENDEVVKVNEVVTRNIDMPKLSFGIKINTKRIDINDDYKLNIYINLIFNILFGVSSIFFEKMNNRKYLSMPVGIDKINAGNHMLITLMCETNYPSKLTNEIIKELNNINVTNDDLEIYKRSLLSGYIRMYDNIEALNDNIVNNIVNYNKYYSNSIELIKDLNINELNNIINNIDLSNTSVYTVLPANFVEKAGEV